MAFKDLVTPEQRETKAYKVMRVYYIASWGFMVIGVIGLIYSVSFLIYKQVWTKPEAYVYSILMLVLPLIPLSGGIYGIYNTKKGLREANWDYIFKVEAETEHPPWTKIKR
ncbi:hypothetical protein BHF71_08505 [Vulcanibacillus modesticaldus]|uniref:Uncharacterized protein n=1 Tax=Vulcanibacillus modesticaldus TaxID=337097 RepID=A0A1D2YV41_9BACI|nr:hypothetical protein [Vulcanibacillus modesticaldus]OEF99578.1 hypothetical protein BHF71_08505 [Vulcanibacillus modesticaldus]